MNKYEIMTELDWDDIDKPSRILIASFLTLLKSTKRITNTKGNCCYDLLWEKNNGQKIAIEIKDRTFGSNKYGDIFAEDLKLECNLHRIDKGEYERALAINVYTDGIFAINDMYAKDAKHFKCWCNETTMIKGGSHRKVLKDCMSLKLKIKIGFLKDGDNYIFKCIKR